MSFFVVMTTETRGFMKFMHLCNNYLTNLRVYVMIILQIYAFM